MGDYITQADIEETISDQRLRALTDDEVNGAIASPIVTKAIDSAEGEVNQFVGKKYTVPITGTIPEPVKRWSLTLAVYNLYKRRPPVPDDIRDDRVETLVQLRECAQGEISLDIGSGGASESSGYEPEFTYDSRVFNRTKFEGW